MLVGWIAAYGLAAATILAAMVLVMVLHLTGARWWLVLRGLFVAVAGTAPILVPLFIPIGAAATLVYPWSTPPTNLPERVSEALEHQRLWNQPGPFVTRSAVYLVTWSALALLVRRADAAHLRGNGHDLAPNEKTLSAAGLPVLAFTLTFASFDWLMSLQPGWSSSAFGLYVFT
ncbi:MAG: hypothetical protein K0S65_1425, partial [Labilithrix sp.]|nr:hypothetical protein [Labilithrix sp.]